LRSRTEIDRGFVQVKHCSAGQQHAASTVADKIEVVSTTLAGTVKNIASYHILLSIEALGDRHARITLEVIELQPITTTVALGVAA